MPAFRRFLRERPRLAPALCFGLATGVLTHFAWIPSARFNGQIPAVTLLAGLTHAVSGALTGPRLIDASRTRTSSQAALVGARTSLLALAFFAPAMAAFVSVGLAPPRTPVAYLSLTLLTGVFAFLAAGWALLLVCVGVAVGVHRLVSFPPDA